MIDYLTLKNWPFGVIDFSYDVKEVILYALGCGVGTRSLNSIDLDFLYEKNLKVLPSMAATICTPGFWWRNAETKVHWPSVLHAEQDVEFIKELPRSGRVKGYNRVTHVHDRGQSKGAVVALERKIVDDLGETIAVAKRIEILRSDGGFSQKDGRHDPLPPRLDRHDMDKGQSYCSWNAQIDPRAHYIFRLSGDPNPLHIDPEAAKTAGFEKPIFHGLGLFGLTTYLMLSNLVDGEVGKLKRLATKFSAPTYPGEHLTYRVWKIKEGFFHFNVESVDRKITVLENGLVEFKAD